MDDDKISVGVLEDHPATAEGYRVILERDPAIEVGFIINYGEKLFETLDRHPVDVLLLDMQVITSADDPSPYTTMHLVPQLMERYPDLSVLIISMFDLRPMIEAMLKAGVDGYVLKDDHEAYKNLPGLIHSIAAGGMYLSPQARQRLIGKHSGELNTILGTRQIEALSLCATYPNERLPRLAARMNIAPPTIRAMLWDAYRKLGVNSRTAAVARVRQMGLLPPEVSSPGGWNSLE